MTTDQMEIPIPERKPGDLFRLSSPGNPYYVWGVGGLTYDDKAHVVEFRCSVYLGQYDREGRTADVLDCFRIALAQMIDRCPDAASAKWVIYP